MELQIGLERDYAKQNINKYFKKTFKELGGDLLVDGVVDSIKKYLNQEHEYTYEVKGEQRFRYDLMQAHFALAHMKLDKIIWKIVTTLLMANCNPLTHQQLVGQMFESIKIDMPSRKLLACQIILEHLAKMPILEVIITKGEAILWKSLVPLGDKDKEVLSNTGYVLPSVVPLQKVTSNSMIGYRTFKESIISGGALKHHDKESCLDHINRKNSIPYCFEPRLYQLVEPRFKPEPKLMKNGHMEELDDVVKRYKSHLQLHESLPKRAAIMVKQGNKFYLAHKYDNRLRTYAKAFEFNYLGEKFLKATVQLHKKELIEPQF